jgi:hypothetical protein
LLREAFSINSIRSRLKRRPWKKRREMQWSTRRGNLRRLRRSTRGWCNRRSKKRLREKKSSRNSRKKLRDRKD